MRYDARMTPSTPGPHAGILVDGAARAARAAARPYLEFLRSGTLSAGLYVLSAGSRRRAAAPREDEVYVVVAGGSLFTAGAETREVRAGDVLFVAAGVPHRFHDISEELRAIVVFAPPEGHARWGTGCA